MTLETDFQVFYGDTVPPFCAWGVKKFMSLHNIDFAEFLKNGISANRLLETGDLNAIEVVNRKLERLRG